MLREFIQCQVLPGEAISRACLQALGAFATLALVHGVAPCVVCIGIRAIRMMLLAVIVSLKC